MWLAVLPTKVFEKLRARAKPVPLPSEAVLLMRRFVELEMRKKPSPPPLVLLWPVAMLPISVLSLLESSAKPSLLPVAVFPINLFEELELSRNADTPKFATVQFFMVTPVTLSMSIPMPTPEPAPSPVMVMPAQLRVIPLLPIASPFPVHGPMLFVRVTEVVRISPQLTEAAKVDVAGVKTAIVEIASKDKRNAVRSSGRNAPPYFQ